MPDAEIGRRLIPLPVAKWPDSEVEVDEPGSVRIAITATVLDGDGLVTEVQQGVLTNGFCIMERVWPEIVSHAGAGAWPGCER